MSTIGTKYPLKDFNIGVNIDAIMQRSVGARGVSGVKQIAIASDSVRGDLITENYCMRVMMMSPVLKPSLQA